MPFKWSVERVESSGFYEGLLIYIYMYIHHTTKLTYIVTDWMKTSDKLIFTINLSGNPFVNSRVVFSDSGAALLG